MFDIKVQNGSIAGETKRIDLGRLRDDCQIAPAR